MAEGRRARLELDGDVEDVRSAGDVRVGGEGAVALGHELVDTLSLLRLEDARLVDVGLLEGVAHARREAVPAGALRGR